MRSLRHVVVTCSDRVHVYVRLNESETQARDMISKHCQSRKFDRPWVDLNTLLVFTSKHCQSRKALVLIARFTFYLFMQDLGPFAFAIVSFDVQISEILAGISQFLIGLRFDQ